MRSIKKLLSIVMVLTLVLSLGASAFAAGLVPGLSENVRTTITVKESDGSSTGGVYAAYQLMTLTTSEDNEHFSYTVDPDYSAAMQEAAGVGSDEAVIKYLEEHSSDADAVRKFADAVYEAIKGMPTDITAAGNVFENVEQGYYLIVETTAAADGEGVGVKSLVMLDTAGRAAVDVTTKEEKPSSEKKVKDVNDSAADSETGWQDSADYDIGDDVPFQLTATIPAGTTSSYKSYKLAFHDKESKGLSFNNDVVVKLNGKEVDKSAYSVSVPGADGCTFDVTFTDIKSIAGFNAADLNTITVEYTSKLLDSAVIGGVGNPNEMHIEYSNNPYEEGTGKTPEDKVVVFTFDLDVNKVDGNGKPLTGAAFALYKKVAPDTDGAVALDEKGKQLGEDAEGAVKEWLPVPLEQKTLKNEKGEAENAKFYGKGLDDGDYKLVETKAPDGYNAIDPKDFTVSAEHDVESDAPELTGVTGTEGFSFTLEPAEGTAMGQTNIENLTGMELPSTGGIGTTIFYVAGAILVAAAVILLVTKRRVNGAEK